MSDVVKAFDSKGLNEAMAGGKPVLVDFWASWCGPCRMMSPVVDAVAEEYADRLTVGKVNVDEETDLSEKYMVMSIPTLILFKGGEQVDRIVGARSPRDLKNWLDQLL